MKLEVWMYARTKNKIIKIFQIIENGIHEFEDEYGRIFEEETNNKVIIYIDNDGWNCGLNETEIVKTSNNILDLIEIGDYVNGLPVIYNAIDRGGNIVILNNGSVYNEEEIKSIVTKEQFESIEYKRCIWNIRFLKTINRILISSTEKEKIKYLLEMFL